MRKGLKYIIIGLVLILTISTINSVDAYSRVKHSITKSKHKKKLKTRHTASVTKSLFLLKEYFPEYNNMEYLSEMSFLKDITNLDEEQNNSVFDDAGLRYQLIQNINKFLGEPYKRGGRGGKGFDCSNFVSVVIEETLGFKFPAVASYQSTFFKPIKDIEELQFGDLVFFSGSHSKKAKRIGHVGIYIDNGLFAQSSSANSGRGVKYSLLSDGYYTERFRYGGRFTRTNWANNIHTTKHNEDNSSQLTN
jgi:cell wall-associated NlpC family hydrolase